MGTYSYTTNYEGYQLEAVYEYEAADEQVGAAATCTVVELHINGSAHDAMDLVDPAVIVWLEQQIATNHDSSGYSEGCDFDDWRYTRAAA